MRTGLEGLGCGAPGLNRAEVDFGMKETVVIANGREVSTEFPCTVEEFLCSQNLMPRSVVVEHNGEAVAPSSFAGRRLSPGDRLEIVRIVAGG